jgi:lactoylglutathione lyase
MNLGWLEVSFAVRDVGVTRAFYEQLGFQLVSVDDGGMSATLRSGGCRLGLYQGVLKPSESQLIFWQGDVEAGAAALERDGVAFVRELETNARGEASFMARDPDGQLIFVIREDGVTLDGPAAPEPTPGLGFFRAALPVKDPRRTAAFYEVLGFRRADDDPDERMIALINDEEARIILYQGCLDPDELQLNFWQGDIEALAGRVERRGLRFFRGPDRDGAGASFMLKDPDGRPVFFINMHKYNDWKA